MKAHFGGAPPEEARPPTQLLRMPPQLRRHAQVRRVAAHATTFQLLASIIAPFLAIHTAVDLGKKALKNTRVARHGPTACGLALIPLLPLSDEPIETGASRCAAALFGRAG